MVGKYLYFILIISNIYMRERDRERDQTLLKYFMHYFYILVKIGGMNFTPPQFVT